LSNLDVLANWLNFESILELTMKVGVTSSIHNYWDKESKVLIGFKNEGLPMSVAACYFCKACIITN